MEGLMLERRVRRGVRLKDGWRLGGTWTDKGRRS